MKKIKNNYLISLSILKNLITQLNKEIFNILS